MMFVEVMVVEVIFAASCLLLPGRLRVIATCCGLNEVNDMRPDWQ